MEKASVFLKRIMLGILLAVLLVTLGLILREGLTARSYLAALVLGALWCLGLYVLLRRGALDPPPHAALRAMLLCLVLNGLWVSLVRIEPFSDYAEYWDVARALADGQREAGGGAKALREQLRDLAGGGGALEADGGAGIEAERAVAFLDGAGEWDELRFHGVGILPEIARLG